MLSKIPYKLIRSLIAFSTLARLIGSFFDLPFSALRTAVSILPKKDSILRLVLQKNAAILNWAAWFLMAADRRDETDKEPYNSAFQVSVPINVVAARAIFSLSFPGKSPQMPAVLFQRAPFAFLAISRRRSALIDLAREGPPASPPLRVDSFRLSGTTDSANTA